MDETEKQKHIEGGEKARKVEDYRQGRDPTKGVAQIKSEYLKHPQGGNVPQHRVDDDEAEGNTFKTSGVKASYGSRLPQAEQQPNGEENAESGAPSDQNTLEPKDPNVQSNGQTNQPKPKKKWEKKGKKETGQNKERKFGKWGDKIKLCSSRQFSNEFSPAECQHGEKCKFEHDLRKYLEQGKLPDLTEGFETCPVFAEHGFCAVGWQCRWAGSHSKEVEHEDGRKELILLRDEEKMKAAGFDEKTKAMGARVHNVIETKDKIDLERRRVKLDRSDQYQTWLIEAWNPKERKQHNPPKKTEESTPTEISREGDTAVADGNKVNGDEVTMTNGEVAGEEGVKLPQDDAKQDIRAAYKEPPFRASEKRRLYYGPETPVLAPLTTQGNLPFRRLCIDLGAQVTWSEMAMGLPLIQGQKAEWALVKTHEAEMLPPTVNAGATVIEGYDNSKDMKFGVQIAANKPWIAFKATEVLAKYTPRIRAIDFNCGCPIDMVFNSGGGSAFLDMQPKLEKILRGMNALSGEIPIQVKVRTGVKDKDFSAHKLAERLILGGQSAQEDGLGPCGIAAMTLHGRSRQQRYTRLADWKYIGYCSAMIKDLKNKQAAVADTVREADPRDQPNGGQVYFIGNGDVYNPSEYQDHIAKAGVDSVMIGRGALIKPWLFEEIQTGQPIDKSSTERLEYIKTFCKYGLDTWGSDEMGVGTTRRFLLEWLSFTHRYIPLGVLERPAMINERPPPYVGRDEKETLLASDDYRDWIKISEMFLDPSHKDFKFTPKHKSNAYDKETQVEG